MSESKEILMAMRERRVRAFFNFEQHVDVVISEGAVS